MRGGFMAGPRRVLRGQAPLSTVAIASINLPIHALSVACRAPVGSPVACAGDGRGRHRGTRGLAHRVPAGDPRASSRAGFDHPAI